jgi:hypothetical protein
MKPNLTLPALHLFLSGIYGLRRGYRYLYIGQSIDLFRRIIHLRKNMQVGDELDFWFCTQYELDTKERELIKLHNPELNKLRPDVPNPLEEYLRQERKRRARFGRRLSKAV